MGKRVGDEIYHTTAWRKLRRYYFEAQHGICEWCGMPGKIVDHIEPITLENKNDPDITHNIDNLQLLCLNCHNRKTFKKYYSTRNGFAFDEQGNLIQVGE